MEICYHGCSVGYGGLVMYVMITTLGLVAAVTSDGDELSLLNDKSSLCDTSL